MIGITEFAYISPIEALIRLVAAALLGLLVGIDREIKHKPIGMRAYMLVAVGSAAFSIITMELGHITVPLEGVSQVDISRVIQGIIGGIGFLGAGAIIQSGQNIRGTGTGASIWCVGAIGIACGFGFYFFAAMTALLALIILVSIGFLRDNVKELKDGD